MEAKICMPKHFIQNGNLSVEGKRAQYLGFVFIQFIIESSTELEESTQKFS